MQVVMVLLQVHTMEQVEVVEQVQSVEQGLVQMEVMEEMV